MKGLLKLRHLPIAFLHKASALFLNIATRLYNGGQIGRFFECEAATLDEYLTSDYNS